MEGEKPRLVFEFENEAQLDEFATWMSESGEQEYSEWCTYGTEDDPRPNMVFDYHATRVVDGAEVYGEWLEDGVIRCTEVGDGG